MVGYTKKSLKVFTIGNDTLNLIEYIKVYQDFTKKDENFKNIIYRLIFEDEEYNNYSNVNIVCEYEFMKTLELFKTKYNEDYYIDLEKPAKNTYQDLAYFIILTYFNLNDDNHFKNNNK
tara:strand:+ start:567 stop:923 length:357 start_codon:yes stop_codon:yes gene_type:complete